MVRQARSSCARRPRCRRRPFRHHRRPRRPRRLEHLQRVGHAVVQQQAGHDGRGGQEEEGHGALAGLEDRHRLVREAAVLDESLQEGVFAGPAGGKGLREEAALSITS